MFPGAGPDYWARLDGAGGRIWEPLWQLETRLEPVEQELLGCPALRRLHFIHHAGAAYLSTPHTYSRLQHTLGVFALAAHFQPEHALLRVAALLHDVGHAPFSHTLEQLEGIDHHRWTVERVVSPPVTAILQRFGLDPQAVLKYMAGEPANPLRNRDNLLHLDHLDSWVRSGQAGGILPEPASWLLARLRLAGPHLDTDLATAEMLLDLIVAEARFHASAANLGTNVVLQRLVRQALEEGALSTAGLAHMTDIQVEQILFATPATAQETRRLWFRPDTLHVRRLDAESPPAGAYLASLRQLYLAVPLANGRPVTQVSSRAARRINKAQQLAGDYAVIWGRAGD